MDKPQLLTTTFFFSLVTRR